MNSITPAQLSVGISTPFAPISSDLFSRIIPKLQKSGYGTWHVWQDTSYHAPHEAIIRTEEKRTFTVPSVFARALSQNGPRAPFAFHRKVDPKHQIQDPMKPSCRTCVLIPMYSETLSGAPEDIENEDDINTGFLRIFHNLSVQQGLTKEEFEVICIVNNKTQDAEEETLEYQRNQRTIRDLESLSRGDIPKGYGEMVQHEAQKLIDSGLKIHTLDMSSKGMTFKQCNVGVARDYGALEALRRFETIGRDDGILLWIDADCAISSEYVVKIRDEFDRDPRVTIVKPYLRNSIPNHSARFFHAEVYFLAINHLNNLVDWIWEQENDAKVSYRLGVIGGCRLNCRARDYLRSGGIPHFPAAEDVLFSQHLKNLGISVSIREAVVAPNRPSNRADAMGSMGQGLLRDLKKVESGRGLLSHFNRIYLRNTLDHLADYKTPYDQAIEKHPDVARVLTREEYNYFTKARAAYLAPDGGGALSYAYEKIMTQVLLPRFKTLFPDQTLKKTLKIIKIKIQGFLGKEAWQLIDEKMRKDQKEKNEQASAWFLLFCYMVFMFNKTDMTPEDWDELYKGIGRNDSSSLERLVTKILSHLDEAEQDIVSLYSAEKSFDNLTKIAKTEGIPLEVWMNHFRGSLKLRDEKDPHMPTHFSDHLMAMALEMGDPKYVHSELSPYKKAADMLGLTLEILYNWDRSPGKKPIRIVNQLTRW